jgi:hypothetical protein
VSGPDRVAAWATGAGIGLIAFMLAWLVGNRLTGLVWGPPAGPIVAFLAAVAAGAITTLVFGIRLSRRAPQREDPPPG